MRRRARAERGEATRRAVVDAVVPLFVEQGYLETTMSSVARAAGVAVQTLYLSFGSKAAVLEAALAAVAQDQPNGLPDPGDDGPTLLARHVTGTAAAMERQYPLAAVLRAAAADPDPAELLTRMRRAALATHARAVDELAEHPGFTDRISLQRATEIVATVLSPESYGLLVTGHGWPLGDWTDWATRHLVVDLFP